MHLVDIPEVGLLKKSDAEAPRTGAPRTGANYAQDKEAKSKNTNASASTPTSGAFAFGPENREVIH
jgi:hypothetical protein